MYKILVTDSFIKEGTNLPVRGTARSAGIDVYTMFSVFIPVGKTVAIGHGIKLISSHHGYVFAMTTARSSANMEGIIIHNGVIDADYSGELKTLVTNVSNRSIKKINKATSLIEEGISIEKNTRISQIVFINTTSNDDIKIYFENDESRIEAIQVLKQDRDQQGFGSTGKN